MQVGQEMHRTRKGMGSMNGEMGSAENATYREIVSQSKAWEGVLTAVVELDLEG